MIGKPDNVMFLADHLTGGHEVHSIGGWWGNRIDFTHFKEDAPNGFNSKTVINIDGHRTPHPKVGDFLEAAMASGRTMLFRITEIEGCRDPADMFFGKCVAVGYVDDINERNEVLA